MITSRVTRCVVRKCLCRNCANRHGNSKRLTWHRCGCLVRPEMTDRHGTADRRELRQGGRRRDDGAADCVWLPRDWAPSRRCPLLVAIDDAPDWRTTGHLFRSACAGRPLLILAPNIAGHTTDSMIAWIRSVSRLCGGAGSYFVYGRGSAAPAAVSLAIREATSTAALVLVSPPSRVAWTADAGRAGGNGTAKGIAVRAIFGAADAELDTRLLEWRESVAAARRAGFDHLDVAIVDGTAESCFIDETLRFFEDARVSASANSSATTPSGS